MNTNINLTEDIFKRLEAKAIGFDTPEMVIKRLLDEVDGKPVIKPVITFDPSDENDFKKCLLETKEAEIAIYKADGTREIFHWNAPNFGEYSNLRRNLWSGYLRGWKEKNIVKAELIILPRSTTDPEDNTGQIKMLSLEIGLKYEELESLDYTILNNESNDGLVYVHRVEFHEDSPEEILNMIEGLYDGRFVDISSNVFDQPDYDEF